MAELPFDIPPSLLSYLEQYDSAPEKTLSRLEGHMKKRGTDAVGYFLLAWFYHRQQKEDQAIEAALKARLFAPGSPFFEKAHYFFSHPEVFDAWCSTEITAAGTASNYGYHKSGPSLNLDHLIKQLAKVESSRITYTQDQQSESGRTANDQSDNVDDIVTETLATIHEKQGKIEAAINAYERLKRSNKEKAAVYEERIRNLKERKGETS